MSLSRCLPRSSASSVVRLAHRRCALSFPLNRPSSAHIPAARKSILPAKRTISSNIPPVPSPWTLPTVGIPPPSSFSSITEPFQSLLYLPHELLVQCHELGLSWAMAIPLATITVRLGLAYLLQIPAHMRSIRLIEISPYLSARTSWTKHVKYHDLPMVDRQTQQMKVWVDRIKTRYRTSIWSIQAFRIAHIFPWICFVETIRRMTGQAGLLSSLGAWLTGNPKPDGAASVWVEPSMAVEGALWFPNLLAPDPLHVLPVVLSVTMLASLSLASSTTPKIDWLYGASHRDFIVRGMRNLQIVFALVIAPLTWNVPSAILLYWCTSSISALSINLLLNVFKPLPVPVRSCERGFHLLTPVVGFLKEAKVFEAAHQKATKQIKTVRRT